VFFLLQVGEIVMEMKSITETVTLSEARSIIECLASEQSVLLLSPPGIGKSDTIVQAAEAAGLPCRSLLGTQIAPEDVSGIPRIVGERSVFCPPRILLPEDPKPFCLFLDELPACSPDIQKAFYSLLLERRLGEHPLPKGTWVVAAGNRVEDRALVRSLSSALVNRVVILNVRVDNHEWLQWAKLNGIRSEILSFLTFMPDALMRPVPNAPVPFSTPRAWASFSRSLDLTEARGVLNARTRRALAFGRVSAEDAAIFCSMLDSGLEHLPSANDCLKNVALLPSEPSAAWFVLQRIRIAISERTVDGLTAAEINEFLTTLNQEYRFALLVDLVPQWGELGANQALLETLREVTGL
jgi:MoxR-like ATPase